MRLTILLLVVFINSHTTFAQQQTQVKSATISFVFVNNDVDGTLEGFSSSSTLDLNTITNSKFQGSVLVETISTGNSIRDWSLKRAKYFDADTYPQITFESTHIKETGAEIIVTGQLKIKDVTKQVIFTFKKNDAILEGTATVNSSDFGIFVKKKPEQNKVTVKIALELK